jgi:LmbE family N-acetylglucosaminyl deacetylase
MGTKVRTIDGVEYWTTAKAAEYLGVTKPTLLSYAKQNRVNKLKVKDYTLFKQEWLDNFTKLNAERKTKPKKVHDLEIKNINGVEYWTTAKAARYLGIAKPTLLSYAKQNLINTINFNSFVLHKKEWLDNFLTKSTEFGATTHNLKNRKFSK